MICNSNTFYSNTSLKALDSSIHAVVWLECVQIKNKEIERLSWVINTETQRKNKITCAVSVRVHAVAASSSEACEWKNLNRAQLCSE